MWAVPSSSQTFSFYCTYLYALNQVLLYHSPQGHWINHLISPSINFLMIKYHLSHLLQKIVGQSNRIIYMKMPHKLRSKFKEACLSAGRAQAYRKEANIFSRSPWQADWGRADCFILCSGTFSLLEQKKTNARGNPQYQVLFQRQKTD